MVMQLYLGVIILAVFAATFVNADIQVLCENTSVSITWRLSKEFVPHAARFFLGSCMPSHLNIMPTGEGEALFNYQFADCKFKKVIKGKHLIFRNKLTYRPYNKSKPPFFVYPIECLYKRPERWYPPFLNPGAGVAEGQGSLVFHMALLNEQLTGVAMKNVIPLGSFMPIWAAVEQKSHQPLLLLMEECVAATTPDLQPDSQLYPIITNNGCLLESVRGNAVFLPRYHSSAIIVYMQSFKFGLGQEVYIHCNLIAWDLEGLDKSKKACHYMKQNERWELLDDLSRSSLCSCCDSTCKSRSRRGTWKSHSLRHKSVLGPLLIVNPSDSEALNP
ncbi:zona pellucida sperm-binding protein 3-like [Channa argus]|uniref:zona pellucida sperm-binding protein 3-like n=1 Tax=Channa argus TaxID=215402 RepID=UPI003520709F